MTDVALLASTSYLAQFGKNLCVGNVKSLLCTSHEIAVPESSVAEVSSITRTNPVLSPINKRLFVSSVAMARMAMSDPSLYTKYETLLLFRFNMMTLVGYPPEVLEYPKYNLLLKWCSHDVVRSATPGMSFTVSFLNSGSSESSVIF